MAESPVNGGGPEVDFPTGNETGVAGVGLGPEELEAEIEVGVGAELEVDVEQDPGMELEIEPVGGFGLGIGGACDGLGVAIVAPLGAGLGMTFVLGVVFRLVGTGPGRADGWSAGPAPGVRIGARGWSGERI